MELLVAINASKVAAGGIAAGLTMAVLDIAMSKLYFGSKMVAEMNAYKPGTGDAMTASGWWMAPLINGILTGILLIWLYAAIRSRFGPGQKTAVYAAIYFWIVASVFTSAYGMMGMMSWGLWGAYSIAWLVILIIAASVGGRIYTEDGTTV